MLGVDLTLGLTPFVNNSDLNQPQRSGNTSYGATIAHPGPTDGAVW